jgi:hypothetical protein
VCWFELLRSAFLTPSLAQEHAVLPHGEEGGRPCELPWVLSLSLSLSLSLLPSSHTTYVLFAKKSRAHYVVMFSEANHKIGHNVCKMQHTSSWLRCDVHNLIGSFPAAVPGGRVEKLWQEFFGSFAMVGSQFREGN